MTTYIVSGASRGIGAAFVGKILEDSETRVAACARGPSRSPALQSLCKIYGNDRLLLLEMDITKVESIKAVADLVSNKWGFVDVLINNAGIIGDVDPCSLLEEPLEQIDAIFRTNVLGSLASTRAFYPLLLKGSRKTVVNVTSILGSVDWHMETIAAPELDPTKAFMGGYAISKAALNMQTAMLANRTKVDSVIVISIHPGMVDTEMAGRMISFFGLPPVAISTEESVAAQLKVIDGLSVDDNGKLFNYDGSILAF